MKTILVTGGAGYVGSELIPKLSKIYSKVKVLDTFWFSDESIFSELENVEPIKADIRDLEAVKLALTGVDHVIHLACISNDPSYDLNPELAKTINYDCFEPIIKSCVEQGISRFIYASSSSVYGVKDEDEVTEDLEPFPLTDYSKYKLQCEEILHRYASDTFTAVTLRPATVCGVSKRQRLDVIVNILTTNAFINDEIKVFGGDQKRPNIHITDMCEAYIELLKAPKEIINNKIYNIGAKNHTVKELSHLVSELLNVSNIKITKTDDNRSYKICSKKIFDEIGFRTKHTIEEAIAELHSHLKMNILENPISNPNYYNVKLLKERNIL